VYRFLATPKWVGFAALMIVLSGTMVGLGFWQLDRYHIRHGINTRIDQANATAPVPIGRVISPSRPATDDQEWTRVTVTGTYDAARTVVARDRSVNSEVGFEILVPLRLADGSTIIIDRGWISTGPGNGLNAPAFPGVPGGTVTVTGRIHLPESSGETPTELGGQTTVRRVDPRMIGPAIGLTNTYADYILLDTQSPAAAAGFTRIPADRQPTWLNAGYTVQWWLFAALALVLFAWAARREAQDARDGVVRVRGERATMPRDRLAGLDEPDLQESARGDAALRTEPSDTAAHRSAGAAAVAAPAEDSAPPDVADATRPDQVDQPSDGAASVPLV
jgi:cytochrome oxidase assembly protein ShyY1